MSNSRYCLRNRRFLLGVLFLLLLNTQNCHPVEESAKEKQQSDKKVLLQEQFQALFDATRQESHIPGMAGIVLTSEEILFRGVSGVRKLGSEDSITLDDRFHIGSNAKAMTAFLAGVLVDRGQLTWETKIVDVFPEWKKEIRADYHPVNFRDVLSHRAGIQPFKHEGEFERLPQWEGSAVEVRRSFTAWLLKQKPVEWGSEVHAYSNAGYCVAAAML